MRSNPRYLVLRAFGVVCIVVAYLAPSLGAQFSRDPLTNFLMRNASGIPTIGDQVGTLAQTTGEYRAIKAALSVRIKSARSMFWRLYPDKPGFTEARADFARQLKDKDQYHLFARSVMRNDPLMALLDGGDIDDGVAAPTEQAFELWRQTVLRNLGVGTTKLFQVLFDRQMAKDAVTAADPLYRQYVTLRDWEEFRKQGKVSPDIPPATWQFVLLAMELEKDNPYQQAFVAAETGGQFMQKCPTEVPLALRVSTIPPTACDCLRKVFAGAATQSQWDLNTKFTQETFLIASVSRVGVKEKVAACLR